jgi:hypothetical protein
MFFTTYYHGSISSEVKTFLFFLSVESDNKGNAKRGVSPRLKI